ncbi:hypothetical protein BJ684DRAFT_15025 [Piptocephalis cylindrospora]|uniref:Peptidase metallopeptidase domain-containing protein n=1 Tax=Piptocephalis cylindrospora TaxID=1907219 RepID=A0A4P9Y6L2_9FUNG|nr:hypothetical protein BJ684DRAFT_15025 [Piptocephalis cylindrospora]|eukprot:RKP14665.1 hypothetical protein BJ684DRAFT_15025 [Piptocephalis cylindrospora]
MRSPRWWSPTSIISLLLLSTTTSPAISLVRAEEDSVLLQRYDLTLAPNGRHHYRQVSMDTIRAGSKTILDSLSIPAPESNAKVRAAAVDGEEDQAEGEGGEDGEEEDGEEEEDWVTHPLPQSTVNVDTSPASTPSPTPTPTASSTALPTTSNSTVVSTTGNSTMTPTSTTVSAPSTTLLTMVGSESNLVLVEFTCTPTVTRGKEDVCRKVQKAYESAGRRIGQLLQLTSPIRIQLSYKSFCDTDWGCGSSTLGQAWAASYWEVGGSDGLDSAFLYPQALLKQRGVAGRAMNTYDIIAQFNADQRKRYWFVGDNKNGKPKRGQYEFEYLAIHELMHGLGYTTSLAQRDGRPLVTPGTLLDARNITMAFRKPYLFDRHIYFPNIHASLSSLVPSLTPLAPYNASLTSDSAWWTDYASRPEGRVASLLYTQATAGDGGAVLQIAPNNASVLSSQLAQDNITLATLYTPSGGFERASTLMHLSGPLTAPQDYLMLPEAVKGQVLDTKDGLVGGVFGPTTVRLLSALGYPLLEPVIYRDHTVNSGSGPAKNAAWGGVLASLWIVSSIKREDSHCPHHNGGCHRKKGRGVVGGERKQGERFKGKQGQNKRKEERGEGWTPSTTEEGGKRAWSRMGTGGRVHNPRKGRRGGSLDQGGEPIGSHDRKGQSAEAGKTATGDLDVLLHQGFGTILHLLDNDGKVSEEGDVIRGRSVRSRRESVLTVMKEGKLLHETVSGSLGLEGEDPTSTRPRVLGGKVSGEGEGISGPGESQVKRGTGPDNVHKEPGGLMGLRESSGRG